MVVTKTLTVRKRYDQVIDYVVDTNKTNPLNNNINYVSNNEKTNKQELVTCINCFDDNPHHSMIATKKIFHDDKEIVCFHAIQSFLPNELSIELCHQIGIELAQKVWGDRFEVVIATHTDKPHLHNHFVINATSFVDGKRYCNTKADMNRLKDVSDELCRKYHLSVIEEHSHSKSITHKQYHHNKSLHSIIKNDIDIAIQNSVTLTEFYRTLENEGYEITFKNTDISLKHINAKRPVRLKSLGDNYDIDTIKQRIISHPIQDYQQQNYFDKHKFDILPFWLRFKNNELTGLQKYYLSYLYKFAVIPKKHSVKLTKEMKQDVKYLDMICEHTKFILTNNFTTLEQVQDYKEKQYSKLQELENKKRLIKNKTRRCNNSSLKQQYQEEAKSLTPLIKSLRHDIRACNAIINRTSILVQQKEKPSKDYTR